MRPIKISVVMAVHKDSPFMDLAVASILDQTFRDFEFLIVANAANPTLLSRLKNYGEFDKRIKIISTPMPGLSNALNNGISIAKGEVIARMDSDDISHPERLRIQYEAMLKKPALSVIGCQSMMIGPDGEELGMWRFHRSNEEIRKVLPYLNPILHPSLMIRKDLLIKIGGYRYGHMSEDHELYIRLARDRSIIFENIEPVLFYYRRHDSQITAGKNLKKDFAEISGFLTTEFLLTGNVKYLFGCLVVHPWRRLFSRKVDVFLKKLSANW